MKYIFYVMFLLLVFILYFCFEIKKIANDIEYIGEKLVSNSILYNKLEEGGLSSTEALDYIKLEEKYLYYIDKTGVFRDDKDIYLAYYSGYERILYYYPKHRCWKNLYGGYNFIMLKRCKF
ncbi:hypothetical protein [Acinetobacter haemolyticus]|uniref:hypothetical protein n=1 Tax=Acinetobacter haemolyticus TaxID=29430 RepID=UPI002DBEBDAA|nr:hypothetical protein [Acinetobacter haemolyticus]MEB6677888.1 hypothetical protein [Acinetobacter haemolyticus]